MTEDQAHRAAPLPPTNRGGLGIWGTILKCLIITEFSIVGSFLMLSYNIPVETGFAIWGSVLAGVIFLMWQFGGLSWNEEKDTFRNPAVFFTGLMNGVMINFGGYLILIICLKVIFKFPITIGGM
jgi:hypothetical protein